MKLYRWLACLFFFYNVTLSLAGEIHIVAKNGDIKRITELVDGGVSVDQRDENGFTPLHIAARNGYMDIVKFLISKGAKLNSRDDTAGGTPLHWASYGGQDAVVKFLVEKGADINAITKKAEGLTPLDLAMQRGGARVSNILRSLGAKCGDSVLHVSIGLNASGDVLVDNLHYEDIRECTITLSGGFSLHSSYIGSRDRIMFPVREFRHDDGTRYDPSSGKPDCIKITCMKPAKRSAELCNK